MSDSTGSRDFEFGPVDDDAERRRRQDAAIARASNRSNPIHYPGGLLGRAEAERGVAAALRSRHDAFTDPNITRQLVGHEICSRALFAAARAEGLIS
ncbi:MULTISPECIES: hypothetical protein [unclassified Mycobacterium]|uniref:hypothetical protein n=1 Tax=unclassified Mycobacterium TaxID=2642494 RepID=UPI0008013C99|nr:MULTISPECIES: hypothetical protein [unclassified Mycobacterium]OBG75336.1 hypothetical protein A5700_01825 [Mycobacterium sp. E1214]OBH31603.1 hypothetical protein A5693_15915 [Mycobacterium sp. E1319]